MKWFIALLLVALPARVTAQSSPTAVNVFLDCNQCDGDFIRTEITYVNWVRDRAVANVHVLVSSEDTGGGGDRFTMSFTGLREFAGREDTLVYVTNNNDTSDEVRRGLTRTLAIGLVRYVASTPAGLKRLTITWAPVTGAEAAAPRSDDPWNFWVFTISLNSFFNGEESQQFLNWNGEVEANRTTEQYKIAVELDGSFDRSKFRFMEIDSTETEIVATQEYYGAEVLLVRSLGAHWSAGVEAEASKATFANVSLGVSAGPAVEYSLWPYSEATRRSLVFRYSAGIRSNRYTELTIYNKLEETHPAHQLTSEMAMKQRWGSLNFEAIFSQYLHDARLYNLFTYGSANVRLFKGFSVNFYGSYSRVRDQLSLPQEELTPEEVLLRQQELSTGYRYFGGVGVSYSFGSIFNNIVNPRFGD